MDDFVPNYTGEDLRDFVVVEIHRRYNSKIKVSVAKKTNASTKAAEKAKTYCDFH